MEMFVSVARLVRISSYNNDDMKITPWFHFMSSDFHVVATNAQSGGCYLQGFNVCGICRPHIKTLHEGLKHPLFVWKRCKLWKVLVQSLKLLIHPGRLTFLWMDIVAMFWSTMNCTSLWRGDRDNNEIAADSGEATDITFSQYYLWLLRSRTSDLETTLTSCFGAKCQ